MRIWVWKSAKPFNNETGAAQAVGKDWAETRNNNNALFSSSFSYEFFIIVYKSEEGWESMVRQNNHPSHHHRHHHHHPLDILWFLQLCASNSTLTLLLLHLSNELQCGTAERRNIPTDKSMLVFDDMTTATHAWMASTRLISEKTA